MSYMGIDPSSKTGVATWQEGQAAPELRMIQLKNWAMPEGHCLKEARSKFWKLLKQERPEKLFIEDLVLAGHGNVKVFRKQAMFTGLLQWMACELYIQCELIPIGTWRKHNYSFSKRPKGFDWKGKALDFTDYLGWDHGGDDNAAESGLILRTGLDANGIMNPWMHR